MNGTTTPEFAVLRERAEQAEARAAEVEAILGAWNAQFGTTQLTHAAERLRVSEARVAELEAGYRDLRVAYEQNAEQCVKLNRELGQETTEWLNGTTIQRQRAEKAEARVKELEELAEAKYAQGYSAANRLNTKRREVDQATYNELAALRAANAELETRARVCHEDAERNAARAERAEVANAELAGALRETLEAPDSTISGQLYYRMEQVLARHAAGETAKKYGVQPRFHNPACKTSIPDYLRDYANATDIGKSRKAAEHAAWLRKAANAIEAKHPDTEIIDRFEEMCGSLEYCDADEVRNHWRAYGYSGSNEGVGRTMRDALRAAIDAARAAAGALAAQSEGSISRTRA